MNPPGKWVMMPNLKLAFVPKLEQDSIYGYVYPFVKEGVKGTLWYWEARTDLMTRPDMNFPPNGYVYSQKDAQEIVETLLYMTKTVEKESS
jgi:hypothetical protein